MTELPPASTVAEARVPPGGDEDGILRASAQIAGITALARIAGFARWIVLGLTVGATYLGNTYQTANWVPNVVFELAAGGVLSAVFVPTFVKALEEGRARGHEVASALANTFLLLSLPIVALGIVAAEPIMRALTVGVADPVIRAREVELGAWFLRFFVPQIPLYVLAMVLTGVLHAHRRFVAPAVAPLLSSLVVIGAYLAFGALGRGADLGQASRVQLLILAGGTTLGVVVLATSQIPAAFRVGIRWRPVLGWRDPAVRGAIRAGGWGLGFFAVHQAGLLVTLVLANRVEGGVVAYQIAFAFFELPNALIGLPIAISLFPTLARRFVRGEEAGFASLLSTGIRTTVFLAAPAAAGLVIAGPVIAEALLGRTGPTEGGAALTGAALTILAVGVPAYALVQTVTRAFYSRNRTRPPVALNGVAIAVFAVSATAGTLLAEPQGPAALRLIGGTYAVGMWIGIAAGLALLARRVPAWSPRQDVASIAASVGRAVIMGLAVAGTLAIAGGVAPELRALAAVGSGVLAYGLVSLPSSELRALRALWRERR